MSGLTDLPDWVWQLVAGLQRYEDEHPPLFAMDDVAVYKRTTCPGQLTRLVPIDVQDAAELLASRGAVEVPSLFVADAEVAS